MVAQSLSASDASGPLVHPDLVAGFEAVLVQLGYEVAWQAVAGVCFRLRERTGDPSLSFGDFHRLASALGLTAEAMWVELDDLEEGDLPCIAHLRGNRFVALLHASDQGVAIVDPATGPATVALDELEAAWAGAILSVAHREQTQTQRRLDTVAANATRGRQQALIEASDATRVATTCMSDVYRGDGGTRCFKMVPFYVPEDSFVLASFRRELGILGELGAAGHPNVLSLVEVMDGERCYTTAWFDGTPAASLGEPIAAERTRRILSQVIDGLRFVHANGIVHRDLAPQNVLVDGHDRALIIDLGLAFQVDLGQPALPRAGTYAFRAPEQWRGDVIGPATDVFALGLLAYYLLTNDHPLSGLAEHMSMTDPYQGETLALMWSRIAAICPSLRPLVAGCLAVEPGARCTLDEAARMCAERPISIAPRDIAL